LRLEWAGESAPAPTTPVEPRRLEDSEIALLMKRGEELVASGHIAAARMMFQPAAEAGDPKAALALAETYDPLTLEKLGAKGITPDVALAQQWYQKAKALGSIEAPGRLVALQH
jgi:TPR repeat protein